MASNTIDLLLTFDNKQANASIQLTDQNIIELYKSFKYGQTEADSFFSLMLRGFNNAREILQGFTAVYSGLNFIIGSSVREYQSFETASFQLASSLQQTGVYTDELHQSLLNYASQLQQTTIYSNGQYISLMAQYQAMGLTTEQTKDAALQTANLASLMGGDLNSAAVVMKDLLNGNTDSISKYVSGIDETAVKSGDLSRIMQELNGHIGGQAEAFANTSAGAMARMNNAFSDMQKNIGEAMDFVLTPFVEHINSLINSINNLPPVISGTVGAVTTLSVALAILSATGIGSVIKQMLFKTAVLEAGVLAEVKASLSAAGLSVANLGLSGSFRAAGIAAKTFMSSLGPVGWVVLGIGALAEVLNLFGSSADEATEKMSEQETQLRSSQAEFNNLMNVVRSATASENTRLNAIKELNDKYPDYIDKTLSLTTKEDELAEALKKGNEKFTERIKLAAYESVMKDKFAKATDIQKQIIELQDSIKKDEEILKETKPNVSNYYELGILKSNLEQNKEKLKTLNSQYDEAEKDAESFADRMNSIKTNNGGDDLSDEAFNKQKTALEKNQRHQEEMQRIDGANDEKALRLKLKHFDAMIALYKKFKQDTTDLEYQRIEEAARLKNLETEKDAKLERERTAELKKVTAKSFELPEADYKPQVEALGDAMHAVDVDQKEHEKDKREDTKLTTQQKLELIWAEKEAVADGLGQTSQMFAKHTAAYQAFASAQALIDTYTSAESAYKSMVGIPFVGPALAVGAAAAAIVAGMEQVAQINSIAVPSAPGYALGGRLKQGEAGYIEGWHNEIIAPEKTFVDLFRTELRPQIYSGMSNDNSALLAEMRKLNSNFEGYSNRPITITRDAVGKIVSKGNSQLRKSRV